MTKCPSSSLAQVAPELPNLGAVPESWQNLGKKNGAAVSFVGAGSSSFRNHFRPCIGPSAIRLPDANAPHDAPSG